MTGTAGHDIADWPSAKRRDLGDEISRHVPDHSGVLRGTMTSGASCSTSNSYAHLHDPGTRTENPGVGGSIPSLPTMFCLPDFDNPSPFLVSPGSRRSHPLRRSTWIHRRVKISDFTRQPVSFATSNTARRSSGRWARTASNSLRSKKPVRALRSWSMAM